jgi:microcystin-dependent protein
VFQSSGAVTGTASGTVSVTPIGINDSGDTEDPTSAYPALHTPSADKPFATSTDEAVNMAPISGQFSGAVSIDSINGTVTVGHTGGNYPFNLMQPWLAMYYIIATQGVYPSRN